jgi:hypothetical protein
VNDSGIPELSGLGRAALIVGAIGVVASLAGAWLDPGQFFRSYLVAFLYCAGLSIGCLGILMVYHLTGGSGGVAIRRLLEAGAGVFPLVALLFVPLLFGLPHVYPWTSRATMMADEVLRLKVPYLNVPFFVARAAIYFAVWLALSWASGAIAWTLFSAIALNDVLIGFAFWRSIPLRHIPMPRVQTRWYDLVLRAVMVALLVGTVITLSFHIGASASGNLAVFPIVLTSIIIILHGRVGGPPTAAVMANAVIGLGGFAFAVVALVLTAERLGSPLALTLALAISLICNWLIYLMRQRSAAR